MNKRKISDLQLNYEFLLFSILKKLKNLLKVNFIAINIINYLMYSTDKYGRLKKQIDRYFLPAQITSQFILDAIKLEDKKNQSPMKKKNQTAYKLNQQIHRIEVLKITGKQLNSNFIPLNLTTPKPRNFPNHRKSTIKKSINIQEIKAALNQPIERLVELLQNDPQSYMFSSELNQIRHIIKSSNDAHMKQSIDEIFLQEKQTDLSHESKQRIQNIFNKNLALGQKFIFHYRKEKQNKEKLQASTNISPTRKSNLIDGLISRRVTGTIKKFVQTAYQKNLTPPELKKHYSFIKYRQFLFTINASNRIIIYPDNDIQFKAFITKGNNGTLVKSIIKSRPWWSLRSYSDVDNCSFVWTEWKKKKINQQLSIRSENIESQRNTFFINFYKKSVVHKKQQSPQEDTTSVSKSDEKNLILQNKKRQIQMLYGSNNSELLLRFLNSDQDSNLSSFFTFTKRINQKKFEEISKKYVAHSIHQVREECYIRGKSSSTSHLKKKIGSIKMSNHLPGCLQLHSKKHLFLNLKRYYEKNNLNIFDFLPETYILSSTDYQDTNYKEFQSSWLKNEEDRSQGKTKNIWICKPGQNSNRGQGITVVNSLQEIKNLIKNRNINSKRTLLIQRYIQNPYIYQKRKFDIRCYMLITCVNGYLKCYWYNEGYIRTASKQFSLKNFDKFIHLTNDAIQKKGEQYGKFQSCNKISFSQFQKYLSAQGEDPKRFRSSFTQMKQISRDLVRSCAHKLNPRHRQYCFELFGMDFMLNQRLIPFLIQANSNPCLQVDGNVLSKIIPHVIQNAIKIAVDPIFPPPYSQIAKSSRFSPGNPFQTNKFQLIYDSSFDNDDYHKITEIDAEALEDQDQEFENCTQQ